MEYMITSSTMIDFDPKKLETNFGKHRYALDCMADILQSMLFGRMYAIFSEEFEEGGEPRFMVMAEYQGEVILAVCTWRDAGRTIRVISFRPASSDEETIYLRRRHLLSLPRLLKHSPRKSSAPCQH